MRPAHRRLLLLVFMLLVSVAACSGPMTLPEYADEVESLVTTMNARLDANDDRLPDAPGLEEMKTYARERIDARSDLLEGLEGLTPPEEVEELHDVALGIVRRLVAAEGELAATVESAESVAEIGDLWGSPEGQVARAVDQEAIAICHAAEEALDSGERDLTLEGPWVPPEMQDVIRVAFGCDQADR